MARREIHADVVVTYHGEKITVPQEVASFLEQDRKRSQAQDKQNSRRLDDREYEALLNYHIGKYRETEDTVLQNIRLEALRDALSKLEGNEQRLLDLLYNGELTMEEIGKLTGVSKMAVSKQLKKLHEKLRDSVF